MHRFPVGVAEVRGSAGEAANKLISAVVDIRSRVAISPWWMDGWDLGEDGGG